MQKILSENATYEEVINFLDSVEDIDGMLLECLEASEPCIKVISGDTEVEYGYNDFLRIFDAHGLEGLE